MYEKFYGFQRPPFELVPDPDFLYLGETHDSALANLVLGIESGKGFVAISGAVGAGKTTVLRALLRRIGPGRRVCFLNQPELGVADLLRAILAGFGEAVGTTDVVELRGRIRALLEGLDHPAVLIVDEAHLLTEDSLEQIRLLSNLEEEHRKLLQIVLSGQPELQELLTSPRLRPLTQRIEMFYEILPLDEKETTEYVARRIRIAGNPAGLWFDDDALREIHRRTGGIPRLINILAERCLITGYVAESRRITAEIAREAYRDLGAVTHSVMPGGGAPLAHDPVPVHRPAARPTVPTPSRRSAPRPDAPAPARSGRPRSKVAPLPPRTARGDDDRRERWIAAAGLAAVALLALVSLGGRGLGPTAAAPGPAATAALPAPTAPAAVPPSATATSPVGSPSTGSPSVAPDDGTAAPDPAGDLAPAASSAEGTWTVHVASFRELDRAHRFADTMREETGETLRVSPTEVESGLWYRVLLGTYATEALAEAARTRLGDRTDFPFLRVVRLVHPEERDASNDAALGRGTGRSR